VSQAKALGYTSLVALLLGGAAVLTMQHAFDARDVTEVSTLADAIALAKRQRVSLTPFTSLDVAAAAWSHAGIMPWCPETQITRLCVPSAMACAVQTAVQQEFAKRIDGSRDDGKPP
jgi:hypothetical protein